jgi:hypothetical protein
MARGGCSGMAMCLVAVGLGLVACGNDGIEAATSDMAIAERANLRLDDFPSGWHQQHREDDDDADEASRERIAACAGYEVEEMFEDDAERAESPTFVSPHEEEIQSSVVVYPSLEVAARRYDLASDPALYDCMGEELYQRLLSEVPPAGVRIQEVEVSPLQTSRLGDATFGVRMVTRFEVNDRRVSGYSDLVVVRIGRAAVTVNAASMSLPHPVGELEGYVEAVTSRLDLADLE